ncbi:MAG: hypothetical protein ABIE23_02205 [archaeon]
MKAFFKVKELQQDWRPPFEKRIEERELEVKEGQEFEADGDGKKVFKLLRAGNGRTLIEYSREYTPKGYCQPQNREFWLDRNESKSFSALWNNNGVTKTITLVKVVEENEFQASNSGENRPQDGPGKDCQSGSPCIG